MNKDGCHCWLAQHSSLFDVLSDSVAIASKREYRRLILDLD